MGDPDIVGKIFGWTGTAICIYFFLAPVVPFLEVLKGKLNYKDSPGVLLIMSFMNCALWADYGLVKNDFQVYFANGIGGTITLVWITIYLIFLGKTSPCLAFVYNAGLVLIVIGLMLLFYFIVSMTMTGYCAMIFNVLMYAAPGEKIYQICKGASYQLIPIWSTIGGTACSTSWMCYGIYQKDIYVVIPNALGVLASIVQIVIFVIYRRKQKNKAQSEETTKE